jgi:hypothetical protein
MMKLCTHDVVTMSSDDVDASSTLIVPNAHGLIITSGEYPRQFMMKEGGSNIVNMSFKGKHTSFLLEVPNLNECIISS